MPDRTPRGIDVDNLEADLARASQALEAFANNEGARAVDALGERFSRLGTTIGNSLERAAATGELSFRRLATQVAASLAQIAAEQLLNGLFGARGNSGQSPGNGNAAGNAFTFNFAPPNSGNKAGGGAYRAAGQVTASILRALQHGARFG